MFVRITKVHKLKTFDNQQVCSWRRAKESRGRSQSPLEATRETSMEMSPTQSRKGFIREGTPLLPALVDKLAHALKRNVQLLHARGIGAADVSLAALAKRGAGDSRDFVLVQQPLTERLAVQARLFDAGKT